MLEPYFAHQPNAMTSALGEKRMPLKLKRLIDSSRGKELLVARDMSVAPAALDGTACPALNGA